MQKPSFLKVKRISELWGDSS